MHRKNFLAFILTIIMAVVYGQTLAPGLTWANFGADGGDLIAAAATNGIAHPSGYPLYLLIARGFQLLPFKGLAFRTNLLSATFATLTVLLTYLILAKEMRKSQPGHDDFLVAFFGALSFGLSPLFWSQAVITEVYTLHLFFVVLLTYLLLFAPERKNLQGFLVGLAVSNHLTATIFLPVIYAFNFRGQAEKKKAWKDALFQTIFFLFGASPYLVLPLRAARNPILNWENPVTWQNFLNLISGRIYRASYLMGNVSSIFEKLQQGSALLLEQFGLVGLALGFAGLVFLFQKNRFYGLTLWLALALIGIFFLYQAPSAHLYLLPFFLVFSLWGGIALGQGLVFLRVKNVFLPSLLLMFFAGNLLWRTPRIWDMVDASRDTRAEDFLAEVLDEAPQDAILFVEGDQAVFALWYGHYALGLRPDLVVVADDLLGYGWYQASIRAHYPSLNLPVSFPWASSVISSNPERPFCGVHYHPPDPIDCFPAGE